MNNKGNRKEFVEMLCPICGKYMFVDDTDLEKEDPDYEGKQDDFCPVCGWVYDLEQVNDPDLDNGKNRMNLKDYTKWYQTKISENPNYNYSDDNYVEHPHICPVCGLHTFSDEGSFEICPICGWEDDGIMEKEPDRWAGTANDLSLNNFRKRYEESTARNIKK